MKNENARIIDGLTVKQIKYAAFKLRQFPAFRGVEVCDIEQDLAVELIESMQKFNTDLSKKSYFVDQVLNSRSKNLLLKKSESITKNTVLLMKSTMLRIQESILTTV